MVNEAMAAASGVTSGSLRLSRDQAVALAHGFTRWRRPGELDDGAPFLLGEAGFAASSRTIAQAIDARSVEATEPFPDGLGVAAEFASDGGCP